MRGVDVGDSRDDLVNHATWWFEAQNRIELRFRIISVKVLRSRNQGLAVMQ
jgi:hypothetical protein